MYFQDGYGFQSRASFFLSPPQSLEILDVMSEKSGTVTIHP